MSYTVVICLPPIPIEDKQAWDQVEEVVERKGSIPPIMHTLLDRLTARYPCPGTLSNGQADQSVWCEGPLSNTLGPQAAVLNLSSACVEEVLPFVVETAMELGMIVLDPQDGCIHRPN